ncbi:MAG: serine protease [Planctomycetes bacterium]|nr:serine protease [Planctomycetota bacterium]
MKPTILQRAGVSLAIALTLSTGFAAAPARETAPLSPAASLPPSLRFRILYDRAAPAVVGIRCTNGEDLYFGSGSIIDPAGLVLTSITVVPAGSKDIQIFVRGGASMGAEILKTVPEKEFSLLRLRAKADGGPPNSGQATFPHLKLGDSVEVQIGEASFTLGNAFNSIDHDDQVSLASGIVSGSYTLPAFRAMARYAGPILETSAAVNDGMDGGPLLNGRGEIIGILSLNFSTNRWLGTAVPIHLIKPLLNDYQARFSDRDQAREIYLGLEVTEGGIADPAGSSSRPLWISQVYRGGPARQAGLRDGHLLRAVNGEPVATLAAFSELLGKVQPGSRVRLRIAPILETGGAGSAEKGQQVEVQKEGEKTEDLEREIAIPAWGRF